MKWLTLIAPLALVAGISLAKADTPGDAKAGQTAFAVCKGCHSLEPGKNGIGPSLHGVFGRKAGSAPAFNYTDAMKAAPVTWGDDTLFKYLADPKAFVPGDKMAFPGIKDEQKRRDVIAYLKSASQ